MGYSTFNEIHQTILRTIKRDLKKGYELYLEYKELYDSLPTSFNQNIKNNQYRKKVDIYSAIKEAGNFLEVQILSAKNKRVTTSDCLDFVIGVMMRADEFFKKESDIRVPEPTGVF